MLRIDSRRQQTTPPEQSSRGNRTLRVGYVSIKPAGDILDYSGTTSAIRRALLATPNVELVDIDDLATRYFTVWRAKQAAYWFAAGRRYWINRQPFVLRDYATQVSRRLASVGPLDVLLSSSSLPLACYSGKIPVVFWSDATFAGYVSLYPDARLMCRETIRTGNRLEQEALSSCSLAIYSSRWAADTAIRAYEVSDDKVAVVPYGANIEMAPAAQDVEDRFSARPARPVRLLFVGGDWLRKGGDVAVGAAESLANRGHQVQLDIVGSTPPSAVPAFVRMHGFLRKYSVQDRQTLHRLFEQSDVLLLPTRADCVPVVIAEACAYGVPCVATDVGGVASVIRPGETGILLPLSASAAEWADAVESLVIDPLRYRSMARRSRALFESDLNWATAVDRVLTLIRDRVA